jgi:hypothetical protein
MGFRKNGYDVSRTASALLSQRLTMMDLAEGGAQMFLGVPESIRESKRVSPR